MMRNQYSGFTYIEVLMVVGLMGIILTFGLVMSMSSVSRSSVIQERDLFVSLLLTGARAQAMANMGQTSHGIHIDNVNNEYVLFDGDDFGTSDPATHRVTPFTNESIQVEHSVEPSNDINVVFEQLSGNAIEGAGIITLSGNGASQVIMINEIGQINW